MCRVTKAIHFGMIDLKNGYVDLDDGRRISAETAHTLFAIASKKHVHRSPNPSSAFRSKHFCPICYATYEGNSCHKCTYTPRGNS